MYIAILGVQAIPYNILIWKLKLPLKIKVFCGTYIREYLNKGQFSKAAVARR
jgi:hypothetical protein